MFGSTSNFDTTTGFDAIISNPPYSPLAAFKFSNLVITGDPVISTANGGPTSLALIGVNGISTAAPGGTLTFEGLDSLLLATQSGPIDLTADVSFLDIPNLFINARGAGSNLTVDSLISGASTLYLHAEGDVNIQSSVLMSPFRANGAFTLSSEILHIFAGNDVNIGLSNPAALDAVTISIFAVNNLNWSGGSLNASASQSSGDIHISADKAINILNDLSIDCNVDIATGRSSSSAGEVVSPTIKVTIDAGTNLDVGGTLSIAVDPTGLVSGGDISVLAENDITIGGDADLLVSPPVVRADAPAGGLGSAAPSIIINAATGKIEADNIFALISQNNSAAEGADIAISAGTNVVADNLDAMIFIQGDCTLGIGGNITVKTGGNLIANNTFIGGGIRLEVNTSFGGIINEGGNVTLDVSGDLSVANASLNLFVRNNNGGHIGTGGNIVATVGGALTANALEATIDNRHGGLIDSGGSIMFDVTGDFTTTNDAVFTFLGASPAQTPPPEIKVTAATIFVDGSLHAYIDDSDGLGPAFGSVGAVTVEATEAETGTITVFNALNVLGTVKADGAITAGTLSSTNVLSDTSINAMAGGITRFALPGRPFTDVLHTLTAPLVTSQSGINFNGVDADGDSSIAGNGGHLIINADSLSISPSGNIVAEDVTFNGGTGSSTFDPGSGGAFTVNTTGDITVQANIEATSGGIQPGAPGPKGDGGSVTLNSSAGTVTVDNDIEVSSAEPTSTIAPTRRSAKGGNIDIKSGKASVSPTNRAVAVNISNSAQLLSLLDAAAPGPGGKITILATGANSDVNVNGTVTADRGTIDIQHEATGGYVNIGGDLASGNSATLRADVIKAQAFGADGKLIIGQGSISADSLLRLYAPGSNGELKFIANVTLSSGTAMDLAADKITILPSVIVSIEGNGGAANVYTNDPNYNFTPGRGYTGPAGNPANGTFGGSQGAHDPKPLIEAPDFNGP